MVILGKEIGNLANRILWLAFLLALFASVHHIAWAFGQLERNPLLGWFPAIAIDGGLAAMAYAIQQRKKAKRRTWLLWVGVTAFATISAVANLLHALDVQSNVAYWKAALFSASLPLLVVYLGEIVSSDDATIAKEKERETARVARKAAKLENQVETPRKSAQPTTQKEKNLETMRQLMENGMEDNATLAQELECSPRTIGNYKKELATNGKLSQP